MDRASADNRWRRRRGSTAGVTDCVSHSFLPSSAWVAKIGELYGTRAERAKFWKAHSEGRIMSRFVKILVQTTRKIKMEESPQI
jgi:hypothetical protein